jgi:hypothetical protein
LIGDSVAGIFEPEAGLSSNMAVVGSELGRGRFMQIKIDSMWQAAVFVMLLATCQSGYSNDISVCAKQGTCSDNRGRGYSCCKTLTTVPESSDFKALKLALDGYVNSLKATTVDQQIQIDLLKRTVKTLADANDILTKRIDDLEQKPRKVP